MEEEEEWSSWGEAGTEGHLEDSLSSEPLCQEEQDLGVEAATAVHIPYHGGEHLLKSVDNTAELGGTIQQTSKYYRISLIVSSAPWWKHKYKLWVLHSFCTLPFRRDTEKSVILPILPHNTHISSSSRPGSQVDV